MSTSSFTPKDIKAAKDKYPDTPLLKLDTSKARMNKNKKQPTYYIPFTMKNVAGKQQPLNLKFVKQIIASSAKIPHGVEEEQAKDVRIAYRRLDMSDLDKTEYEEDKKESLLKSNEELIEAFNIIADEYLSLVEREVLTYKGDKFKLNKNRTVNCFRQTERKAGSDEDGDDNGMIPLPMPIFRIKLEADPETKKIGKSSADKGHRYIVFDMKKTAKQAAENAKKGLKTAVKPVIAKITTSDGNMDLTVKNVKHFITYMSLTGGTIYFDSICISKSGISILCKFTDLHVWRHKVVKQDGLNAEELADNYGFGAGNVDDDDQDMMVDEPEENGSKKNSKGKKGKPSKSLAKALDNDEDGEQPLDDEPTENDGGEEEPEQEVDDPDEVPKKNVKNAKDNKKTTKKASDDETEETEETEKPKEVKDTKKNAKEVKDTKKNTKEVKDTDSDTDSKKGKDTKPAKEVKDTKKPAEKPKKEPEPEPEAEGDAEETEEPEADADAEETEEPEAEADAEENEEDAEEKAEEEKKSAKKPAKPEAKGASLKAGARKK